MSARSVHPHYAIHNLHLIGLAHVPRPSRPTRAEIILKIRRPVRNDLQNRLGEGAGLGGLGSEGVVNRLLKLDHANIIELSVCIPQIADGDISGADLRIGLFNF